MFHKCLKACLKIAFGVPPLGGTAPKPLKGGTPNLRPLISVGFFSHALRTMQRWAQAPARGDLDAPRTVPILTKTASGNRPRAVKCGDIPCWIFAPLL